MLFLPCTIHVQKSNIDLKYSVLKPCFYGLYIFLNRNFVYQTETVHENSKTDYLFID